MIKLIKRITKSSFLLISILIFIFGDFVFEYFKLNNTTTILVYSLLIIATYFSIEKKSLTLNILLSIALFFNLFMVFSDNNTIQIIVFLLSALVFAVITFVLIHQISRTKKISPYVIVEAINGYLLLGVISVLLNSLVILFNSNAISFQGKPHLSDIVYYSYINLTSIGFGDIAPVSAVARKISILTGLSGQLYLAIIIALIVGKISNSKSK